MQPSLMKPRAKQVVRRTLGEPYVGKQLKLRRQNHVMHDLNIQPHDILDADAGDRSIVYWLAYRYPSARVSAVDIDRGAIDAHLRTAWLGRWGTVAHEDRRAGTPNENTVYAHAMKPTD